MTDDLYYTGGSQNSNVIGESVGNGSGINNYQKPVKRNNDK